MIDNSVHICVQDNQDMAQSKDKLRSDLETATSRYVTAMLRYDEALDLYFKCDVEFVDKQSRLREKLIAKAKSSPSHRVWFAVCGQQL